MRRLTPMCVGTMKQQRCRKSASRSQLQSTLPISLIKWQALVEEKLKVTSLNWEGAEVIGIVLGALVAALIAGEFAIRAPEPKLLLQTFIGGLFMGFGAVVSSGCNIGHILSGVPQLSIGLIVGGVSIILGG